MTATTTVTKKEDKMARYIESLAEFAPVRTTSNKDFAVVVFDRVAERTKVLATFATADDAEDAIWRDRGGWSWQDSYRWGTQYEGVCVKRIMDAWEIGR